MGFFSRIFGGPGAEPGLGLDELARRLKLDAAALAATPVGYQELRIKKSSGGVRLLHAPDAPLKTLQRAILHRVLGRLAAHPAAMGFERGKSIATNAAPHVGARVLVKMDLKNFFTATTAQRVRSYFVKLGWGGPAADLLTKLTTHRGGLPQGAPTSPRLSNLVNYLLDARLFALACQLGFVYTRYADDMTFSLREDHAGQILQQNPKTLERGWLPTGPEHERAAVAALIQCTKDVVRALGYSLHQDKKLQIRRRHDCMLVTGLVVNTNLNLPRQTRRRLRAVTHHHQTGRPATLTAAQLQGWQSLQAMVQAQRPTDPPAP